MNFVFYLLILLAIIFVSFVIANDHGEDIYNNIKESMDEFLTDEKE